MSEFDQFRTDVRHLTETLRSKISTLTNISSDQRSSVMTEIENHFRELTEQLDSINKQRIMWDQSENAQAVRFVQEMNTIARQLGESFSHERDRSELFVGAITKTNLVGGSESQKETLVAQRQGIQKGTELIEEVSHGLSNIERAGTSVLIELGRQKETETQIEGKLDKIDEEVTDGNNSIQRMNWREKVKTIVLWVVVGFVIIGLSVFLYFVFQ
jgi:hypothetical protein